MKRLLSVLLVFVMLLGVFSMTALAVNPFTDVPQNAWYYADVDHAYQNGLINGKSATLFKPNDFLTYAEAVKLAAAMNQRYLTGAVTLQNGSPNWYQTYVDYCKEKGIINKTYEWNQAATRAGYMEIFAHALPASAMEEINEIPDGSIPDVAMTHPQADSIYKLYRVGILQGVNAAHHCNPASNIKRAEVAAILTRMMDSSRRVEFSMEGLYIDVQPEDVYSLGVEETGPVTFSVKAAGGEAPYTYQWEYKDNEVVWHPIPGVTEAEMTTQVPLEGLYYEPMFRCVVTDATGKRVTSEPGRILLDLRIETQPEGGNVKVGDTMEAFVEVEGGEAPYSYQWEAHDIGDKWIKAPGETYEKLRMGVGESAAGDDLIYRCVITDSRGVSVTSEPAVFKVAEEVVDTPLTIVEEPSSTRQKEGSTPIFYVEVAGGKAPYTFKWMNISQGQHVELSGYGVQTRSEPAYGWSEMQMIVGGPFDWTTNEEFYCIVTDAAGNQVQTSVFEIDYAGPIALASDGPDQVKPGSTATLTIVALGGYSGRYKFIWMGGNEHTTAVTSWNGVNISTSGNRSVMTIDTSKCTTTQFACRVEDANDATNFKVVDFSYKIQN